MQREMGVRNFLRVAPLFETLDDLHNSKQAMTDLFSVDWYRKHINGEQECMIGYSDSGKDAGRMAAAWGLYEVQVTTPHDIFLLYFWLLQLDALLHEVLWPQPAWSSCVFCKSPLGALGGGEDAVIHTGDSSAC